MDLIQIPTPSFLTGFVESRIGGRSENQDSYGWKDTPFGLLVTVCDGMGGGPGGKMASTIAVNEIIAGVEEGNSEDITTNILIKAIRRANMAIIEYGNEHPSYRGMGSTCTVLIINEECVTAAYVGDSRIYQIRGKSKVYRTFDHSMVFELVKQKVITEEQARLSAQSNVITRALGAKYDVEVDCVQLPFLAGDRFILSTDGIHGSIPEQKFIEMVSNSSQSLGVITDTIATTIDGEGRNNGGGHDNLTLLVVETNVNSIIQNNMNKRLKFLFYALAVMCSISLALNLFYIVSSGNNKNNISETKVQQENYSLRNENDSLKKANDTLKIKIKTLGSSNETSSQRTSYKGK